MNPTEPQICKDPSVYPRVRETMDAYMNRMQYEKVIRDGEKVWESETHDAWIRAEDVGRLPLKVYGSGRIK